MKKDLLSPFYCNFNLERHEIKWGKKKEATPPPVAILHSEGRARSFDMGPTAGCQIPDTRHHADSERPPAATH